MDMQGSELFYNLYTGSLLAENEFVEPYARSCDYIVRGPAFIIPLCLQYGFRLH